MEVLMFLTHVPQAGQFGPWVSIERRHQRTSAKLSITAFRPGAIGSAEASPIRGEIESGECFSGGMIDMQLRANAPTPRIRFQGNGADGADLRVVVQFRDVAADL